MRYNGIRCIDDYGVIIAKGELLGGLTTDEWYGMYQDCG